RSPPDHPAAFRRRPPPLLALPTTHRLPRPGPGRRRHPDRGRLPDHHPRRPTRGGTAPERRTTPTRNPLTGHRHLIAPVAGAATAVVHVRRRSPEAIRPGPRGKIDLAATEASVDATRASPLVTCSARPGDVRTVRTVVSARRGLGSGV